MDTNQLTRLEKAQLASRLLGEVGEYDNAINGAVAEVYAEEVLGMKKAPRGQKGHDGTLNGRRLSVKGKKADAHSDSGTYVAIPHKCWDEVDDVLVVFIEEGTGRITRHVGPIALDDLLPTVRDDHRFYVHRMLEAGADDEKVEF